MTLKTFSYAEFKKGSLRFTLKGHQYLNALVGNLSG